MMVTESVELALSDGTKRSFYYRNTSVGDKGVVEQIFRDHCYELTHFRMTERLLNYAAAETHRNKELLIVDAGANIGASALYFATSYPHSRVVAIEPEKKNFEFLRANCEGLGVVAIEAAIGPKPGKLRLSDPGLSDWGYRVENSGDYEVTVITPGQVLERFPHSAYAPFICKIDIEGGEAALFEENFAWLDEFPLVIIELHDWLLPGQANSRNFIKALLQFNFDFVYRGENAFCFNLSRLKDHAYPADYDVKPPVATHLALVGSLRDESARLQESLREQQNENARLQGSLHEQQDTNARLQESLHEQQDANARLQEELSRQRDQDTVLSAALAEQQSRLAEFRNSLSQLQESLARERQESEQLRGQLAGIVISISWRITAPFRATLEKMPRTAWFLRRSLKLLWWTLTLQLIARVRKHYMWKKGQEAISETGGASSVEERGAAELEALEARGTFNTGWYGSRKLGHAERFEPWVSPSDGQAALAVAKYRQDTNAIAERYLAGHGSEAAPAYHAVIPFAEFQEFLASRSPNRKVSSNAERTTYSIVTPFYRHLGYLKLCAQAVAAMVLAEPQMKLAERVEWVIANDDPEVPDAVLRESLPSALWPLVTILGDGQNRGVPARLNQAIKASRGEWILFLDSDDLIEPQAIKILDHYLRRFPRCRYISSGMIDVDEGNKVLRYRRHEESPDRLLSAGMIASHLRAVRRDVFDDYGMIDPQFDWSQDYELALRVAMHEPLLLIPEYLYRYRWHANSESAGRPGRQIEARDRIREEMVLRFLQQGTAPAPKPELAALRRSERPRHGACIIRTQGHRLELLAEAIDSAETQSLPLAPIVVVHGSDSDYGLIAQWCQSLSARAICLHAAEVVLRRGHPANVGLDYVCRRAEDFDFVCFLDDDDILYPFFAERCAEALAIQQADLVYAQANKREPWEPQNSGPQLLPSACLLSDSNFITINSYCARVSTLIALGTRFDEQMEYLEDWDFLVTLLASGARFAPLFETLSEFRLFGDGNTETKKLPEHWALCKARMAVKCAAVGQALGATHFFRDVFRFPFASRSPLGPWEIEMLLQARARCVAGGLALAAPAMGGGEIPRV